MADDYYFLKDIIKRSDRRNMQWYQNNLKNVLVAAKEKQARGIDASIIIADKLEKILCEKVPPPTVVPAREVPPTAANTMMQPVDPAVLDIMYKSTDKGGTDLYLKERYKIAPEDKYNYRVTTSQDYGWLQKHSRLLGYDSTKARVGLIRETFYRKNNVGPDPPHYGQPAGATVSICSEYSCSV